MGGTSSRRAALTFKIIAECPVSKARASVMSLPHADVETPVFMPVGTQGTLKGMTPRQLEALDCRILLGNTYHLGNRPVRSSVKFLHGPVKIFLTHKFFAARVVRCWREWEVCTNLWAGTELF